MSLMMRTDTTENAHRCRSHEGSLLKAPIARHTETEHVCDIRASEDKRCEERVREKRLD